VGARAAQAAAQKKSAEVVIEADELRSFVGAKREEWWVWVALDKDTRPVVAMVAGDRSERTARCLWDALPEAYRDRAIVATDFLAAYRAVVPEGRHAPAGKEAGLTAHVERFFGTLRQRCGRFVRKTLSFSKAWEHHVGARWCAGTCNVGSPNRHAGVQPPSFRSRNTTHDGLPTGVYWPVKARPPVLRSTRKAVTWSARWLQQ